MDTEALGNVVLVEDTNNRALVTVSDVQSWLALVNPEGSTPLKPRNKVIAKSAIVRERTAVPLFEDDSVDEEEEQYTQAEKGKK